MQHFSDTHNKSKWWWRRCAFDTFQESLVKKGLSFLLLADKLNWTNKETLRCLESLSWYHSLRNTQRHHTQASSPPDLMLSDMTFTSRPAQWKAPQVISPSLSLSLPFPSPPIPCCLFGALPAMVWYQLSLVFTGNTQAQPPTRRCSQAWLEAQTKSHTHTRGCARMTNADHPHTGLRRVTT